jgi:hypothetical protein
MAITGTAGDGDYDQVVGVRPQQSAPKAITGEQGWRGGAIFSLATSRLGNLIQDNYACRCGKSVNKSRIEFSVFVSNVLSVTYDNTSG